VTNLRGKVLPIIDPRLVILLDLRKVLSIQEVEHRTQLAL